MSKKSPSKSSQKAGTGAAPGEKTLVTLLLDRSGSMTKIREETVSGVNDWLANLRTSKADIRLTIVFFDYCLGAMQLEKLFVAKPIAEVADLTWDDFVPRGETPLIDAAFETITAVRDSLKGKKAKAVIAIQTDGQENKSTKHGWEGLRALIAQCEAVGYQFQFMGAGINAYEQGERMGLARSKIMSYGKDRQATRAAFAASAVNTTSFADGSSLDVGYTHAQKYASGDVYEAGAAPAVPGFGSSPGFGSPAVVVGPVGGWPFLMNHASPALPPEAAPKSTGPLDLKWDVDEHAGS